MTNLIGCYIIKINQSYAFIPKCYSPFGTTVVLPDSLGSMVKMMGVPPAVLLHHGNYLYSPLWDRHRTRKVPLYAAMTQVLTAEQIKEMTPDEINKVIKASLVYNEYKWQSKKGLKLKKPTVLSEPLR